MNPTAADIALLALGVTALLVVLTIVGEIARVRTGSAESPVLETYMTRIRSWWVMVALISLALLSGRTGIVLLTAFASFAALREFLTLTTKDPADHLSLALAFYVVLPLQYLLVWLRWEGLHAIFIPVLAFLFLPVVSALRGRPKRFLVRIAETQWALMICIFCVSHLAAPTMLTAPGWADRSVLMVAFLVLTVQLGDLADYYVGRRIGRRRIAAEISPRTWAGFGAGLLASALIGLVISWIVPFGPAGSMAMAALSFAAGTCGNLVMSAIKADRGVRDFSHLIPGQGGFVDQLDSVIFAAPVFYAVVRLFWLR
ncbi:phosphatidate cytidylyltransferase [Wenxinia marina]|uniref:Putative CDP-diglyceride synthetase/phosphatidate cytidylyltransferase n=1 Tax=Wenxinia marina DSM 24838 TaxID=1123501 RepID=A0A0D0Q8S3_9RHOB|nr:phosphatidate cytidylyltransferase [Wenxinia marina]KIQ67508.1 putative CDP-diglyceride synthetase/phosphatidate cytidylyltransferase [Wenxinia marina DSM 24838]GGL68937.1 phosphatidate cytidylyltransferase [Wenxinia marina]